MSNLSRHQRYFVALGIVLAVVLTVSLLLVPSEAWVAVDQRRSSLRTTPDGVAAWARSLDRLGVLSAPRYRSLTEQPPRGAGFVLLEPVLAPSAAEVRELLAWVRQGGVLVYSPVPNGLLMDSLGLSLTTEIADAGTSLEAHRWTSGVDATPSASDGTSRSLTVTVEADSARTLTWVPLSTLDEPSNAKLAWAPEGLGGVLVMPDAEALANRTLGASPLAIVTTRAISDLFETGDTLFFSEYHQGLDGRRGALREAYTLAASTPIGRATLHVALAAVLLLLLSGRRFGSPLPESAADRRSPLEHVEALGRAYQASGTHGPVARRLVRGAVRRMGLRGYADDPETEILSAWASQPEVSSSARAALAALESSPPDLETLSGALDDIVTEHTYRLPRQ